MMDVFRLRDLYDRKERIEVSYPGMRRENTPYVVRHVSTSQVNGFISYSRLDADSLDGVVRGQIDYFDALGLEFEWKVYEHDFPSDLKDRLLRHGFVADDVEAIMVLELDQAPWPLLESPQRKVQQIVDPDLIPQILEVQEEVWQEDKGRLADYLSGSLRQHGSLISVYAAYVEDRPVCSAWLYYDGHSPFASLWGGSTLEEYRGQGYYTALLAARVQEAIRRGARYVTVDASPMSRPILERRGFQLMTRAYACRWPGGRQNNSVS
jgi:GNAT superfamily N-acetyltransferase